MSRNYHQVITDALADLEKHRAEFDAIVCGGDMHGAPMGGTLGYLLDVPVLICCGANHECVVQHSVVLDASGSEITEQTRFVYVDDFCLLGRTLPHTLALCRDRHIVARYQASFRHYQPRNADGAMSVTATDGSVHNVPAVDDWESAPGTPVLGTALEPYASQMPSGTMARYQRRARGLSA